MIWHHVINLAEILDDPAVTGAKVARELHGAPVLGSANLAVESKIAVTTVTGDDGSTDFLKMSIPGHSGLVAGGPAPTLGIVGRLGGLGARPERIGFVSDGDGALAVLAAASKLISMARRGDRLAGDVILATHVDPDAPTEPHEPVPFMGSAVSMETCNDHEVDPAMDAVLSVDTTKGNRIVNHTGIAVTPTVRAGWILRVPDSAIEILERVTGEPAVTMPITMQDIIPYGNLDATGRDFYHVNSILQPAVATNAPVLGVAITATSAVAGCATGASDLRSVEQAARFVVEFAKDFTAGRASLCDEGEFRRLLECYGPMTRLQTFCDPTVSPAQEGHGVRGPVM